MEYKYEHEILAYLNKAKKPLLLSEMAVAFTLDQNALMRPLGSLEEKGMIRKTVEEKTYAEPTPEGQKYFDGTEILPEWRVFLKAKAGKQIADLSPEEKQFGIKWAKDKGLVRIEGGRLIALKEQEGVPSSFKLHLLSAEQADEFTKRGLLKQKAVRNFILEATESGRRAIIEKGPEGEPDPAAAVRKRTGEITVLTSGMLRSGEWKNKKFKEYDVSIPAKNAPMGKIHPITHAMERIRRIFAEMGFEEMQGGYVESAFWNFDALFQPQDHPARELADTFYLEGKEHLPDKALVERVRKAHEKGWGYGWSGKEAEKRVLRTHTTALSARCLAAMKNTPKKYFAVGRVFRNEATDFKHLAEFHQVEGIVAWEKATFRDLLGLLKEFYSKLGFRKIRFRPSYFPYTEPSLEIEVYFEERKEWMEIGGAGIMRPEVSIPLAGVYPVLAWGLSLERPLMMLMGLGDIRTFYRNDLAWLKQAKVKL